MHQIISYRSYEKPIENEKTAKNLRHQQMMKLKLQYSLPTKRENGIEKLWGYLEKKVGENKE